MSRKSSTIVRLNDVVLGSFALMPSSDTLNHLIRYLSTWSGSDKFFTLIQYTLKLIVPFLHLRARLQYRAGLKKDATSSTAASFSSFASIIGDSKMLGRMWGLLPIVQWLSSIERNPPPTRALLTIERLQGWSMLAYYPLEHLYYLRAHDLIPETIPTLSTLFGRSTKRISLNAGTLVMWSCRFWALYVILQFAHLKEDRKLLIMREKNLKKGKGLTEADSEDVSNRWDAYWNELVANASNLPLAIHWSLERGLYSNEILTTVLSLVNGIASFRSGWRATALPSPKTPSKAATQSTAAPDLAIEMAETNAHL